MSEIRGYSAVRGLVLPVEWDDMSRVRAVGIFSASEQIYRVEGDGRGAELLGLLQADVIARGDITEHPVGRRSIRVVEYQVCDQGERR